MNEITAWCLVISASLICSTIAAIVAHYLTKDRDSKMRQSILDREADVRRRQFRKFIVTFRSRMDRISHKDDRAVWDRYTELAPEFRGEAALVDHDFTDTAGFTAHVERVGGWSDTDVYQEARKHNTNIREVICDSIDKLLVLH